MVHRGHVTKNRYIVRKMYIFVHSSGYLGGQSRVNFSFFDPFPVKSDNVIYEWYPIARPLSAPPTSVLCSDQFGWAAATRKKLNILEY